MHGLFEVDMTTAHELLAQGEGLSITGFIVASVARAVAHHPEVHAYRTWSGRLAVHDHVDVATLVEIDTSQGAFPLAHLIRDADVRSVADISEELHKVKASPEESLNGRLVQRVAPVAGHIPGAVAFMYAAMSRSPRLREQTGTVAVTSVGMFAGGPGFAIAPPTLMSVQVVVGGMARRPWVIGDRLLSRDVLDLTVTIDHNVVDGGPATRFGAELRDLIETAAALAHQR